MGTAKKMTDFLNQQEQPTASIQGFVPTDLKQRVLDQFKLDKKEGKKITWDIFLEAACQAYLSERAQRRG